MASNHRKYVIAIDLGGTKILTGIIDPLGNIIHQNRARTPVRIGTEAIIQAIIRSVRRCLETTGISISDIIGLGLGVPGVSSPETGILYASPNLPGWKDVPLCSIIENDLSIKTYLLNDTNAAALGELYYGAAKGASNFIYLNIGTGIGGGIILNGNLYTGHNGMAGEIGHMVIDDKGSLCNCGNSGCWETFVSGSALNRIARYRIQSGIQTDILSYSDGNIDKMDARSIYKAANAGDALAVQLIKDMAYYLGVGLANLVNIFNPEIIVIGGGLTNFGDKLLKPAYEEAGKRAFKQAYEKVRFSRAKLGGNSGILGAAAFVTRRETYND